ncbi:putative oligopeptide transporter, OPT superfamily [Medicago truncatula]|uniref:Oligopeptide transporter OPT family protein n=1 Tax=Medicago truncatula TaxID=3880 RepID=G7KEI9_MEDTR|nr:oligopeptide transporter 5 [Medicago truncatula]AET00810.2 oligopeptide transporter OPT family protein [Medicago truncatula]RHN58034.1 putative oligopeptide transporter, OPT superfamily [Medicago truncatula]
MAGVVQDTLPAHDHDESKLAIADDDTEVDDSPIEQVRLTVSTTDDPTQPALTFRTWIIGLACCIVLAFVNQFFGYRTNPLTITAVSAQIVSLPIGKLMAATLPTTIYKVPFTKWSFTLNPGPFNLKEHALITIFASAGAGGVYAINIITIVKAFYHRNINPIAAFLLAITTQMLGYGWAGMFRRFLVDSPYMWWPSNLVQVSLFRAFHEKEKRLKGGTTRLQFFFLIFVASFGYYIIPGYFFQRISTISVVCLIWKNSVTAQQIGSGMKGLGIGAFSLDWNTVVSFTGSPLAVPGFAIINVLVGFVLFLYVIIPISYWNNFYEAKKFPFISSHTFDSTGATYNVSRILNEATFEIDMDAYNKYSKLYLSIIFAFDYGLSFATLTATVSHVCLFHGKTIIQMWRKTTNALKENAGDVHTRLMKRNYEQVPEWWFMIILVLMVILALACCEGFGKQLQLPWWGVLLSLLIALVFTLPIGVIQATTNQQAGLNVITELIIGFLYPGKPLANVAFKTYGYISMAQALSFLEDFKLGHYMKIPPKAMFIVQLVGTLVASSVYFSTAWWLLTTIPNICDASMLPEGSPWTCPGDDVFYNASIIWGVVGPQRMFTKDGIYPGMNWFFLIGLLAPVPVWLLARKYPNHKWIELINMPLIIGGASGIPPARSINYISWGVVGIFFNFYVYKNFKAWWARHTYILSAALDAGIAFMAVLLYFSLQSYDVFGPTWWGLEADDHCPLAKCPTAPGIVTKGCPVF